MAEARRLGHKVSFSVLYYAKGQGKAVLKEEIGAAEGRYIRKLRPPLNAQIPREDNWRRYDFNAAALKVTLEEILKKEADVLGSAVDRCQEHSLMSALWSLAPDGLYMPP